MNKTKLEEIVDSMPGAERRFVWKQGEIATHIWRILSRKIPAWTQRDLARKANMKESYISHLLSGTANPTLKTICTLEEALGEDIIIAPSPRRAKELAEIEQTHDIQQPHLFMWAVAHRGTVNHESEFITVDSIRNLNQFVNSVA